jgi:hypothetical protein
MGLAINISMNILDAYIKDKQRLQEAEEWDISNQKTRVIDAVNALINSETNSKILTTIYNTINKNDIVSKLHANLDGRFNPNFVQQMKEAMFMALSNYNEDNIQQFLEDFQNNVALNTKKLLTSGTRLSECFSNPAGFKAFRAILPVGRGYKNKGAGEFALAAFNSNIHLRESGGDLDIDGIHIELKTNQTKGGGRLGSKMVTTNDHQHEVIQNFNKQYGDIINFTPGVSMTLRPLLRLFDAQLPVDKTTEVTNEVNKTIDTYKNEGLRKELSYNLISNIFGTKIGKKMSNLIAKGTEHEIIVSEYISDNFKWYQKNENFDRLLVMDLTADVVYSAGSGTEFKKMLPLLKGSVPGIIPTGAHPDETFFQLTAKPIV